MPNEPNGLSETIKCGKKECECDIPVIDSYFINKPEVPQIGIKCPECGKVTVLSKAKSIAYASEYAQIQEDIDTAIGYKTSTVEDMDEFGDRVMRALDAFGYKGSKFAQAKKSIREMVDNVPSYQTFQGLHTLLIGMKIQPNHAMMTTQRVFAAEQPQTPDMGMQQMTYQQPIGQPQMPYQQPMQQPAYQYPQQMPSQMPYQQPMQQPPAQPPAQQHDESITIIEKLGEDGQVIERVIKQPKPSSEPTNGSVAPMNMADQFKEMIEVMSGAGMIKVADDPEPQPTIEDIIERIIPLISPPETAADNNYENLLSEVQSLKNDINQREKESLQAQIDTLTNELHNNTSRDSLSDSQYTESVKKDIESIRIGAFTDALDRVAKPLMDMQANQSKIQTALMIGDIEQKRNAPPGSYAQMFTPSVSDDEVVKDIGKWKERAERARS